MTPAGQALGIQKTLGFERYRRKKSGTENRPEKERALGKRFTNEG